MMPAMSAILYPVAASAEEALARPRGRAARQREAAALGGGPVAFVTEETGPAFASRDAALDAFAGLVDDPRPGRNVTLAPEDGWRRLVERLETGAPSAPVDPVFAEGRRWPRPSAGEGPRTVFRLAVSYWRIGAAERASAGQARAVRRKSDAAALDAAQLRALAQQPLRPVKPQQPLDIGLFEAPAPEAPHILIPDE